MKSLFIKMNLLDYNANPAMETNTEYQMKT